MEALGPVASIIAVVQIAGSVAKLCGGYIADVKDARQDIERLQQKASALRDVLQRMDEGHDGTNSKPQNLSDSVLKSVDQCSQDLGRLNEKLQPKTRHKTMSRVGLRALKWPLSKSSVNEEVRMIEGYLAVFNAALQLGHMYVSNRITYIHTWLRHNFQRYFQGDWPQNRPRSRRPAVKVDLAHRRCGTRLVREPTAPTVPHRYPG